MAPKSKPGRLLFFWYMELYQVSWTSKTISDQSSTWDFGDVPVGDVLAGKNIRFYCKY